MPGQQRGMASLIVAMVLLGIISIMTLFTLSYGIQDRRALAVESATRVVQEAAQAGLDQAVQFFRARTIEIASTWLTSAPGLSRWERCASSDVSVPCGAVAASVRANYWRYHDDRDGRADPTALDMRDAFTDSTGAPVQQLVTSAGDYRIAYDVHALLCLVDTDTPDLQCRPSSDSAAPENNGKAVYPGPYAITLIARARLSESGDEAVKARAIVKETIATRRVEGAAQLRLGVVPGSWSDAGGIDGRGNYAER